MNETFEERMSDFDRRLKEDPESVSFADYPMPNGKVLADSTRPEIEKVADYFLKRGSLYQCLAFLPPDSLEHGVIKRLIKELDDGLEKGRNA